VGDLPDFDVVDIESPPELVDAWIERLAAPSGADDTDFLIACGRLRWIRYVQAMFDAQRPSGPIDLDEAIDAFKRAVSRLRTDPDADPDAFVRLLAQLADAFQSRHENCGGAAEDLAAAIDLGTEALSFVDVGSPPWHGLTRAIVDRYAMRYQLTGADDDFAATDAAARTALDHPGSDPEQRAWIWRQLGGLYDARATVSADPSDRDRSIEALRSGWAEGSFDPMLGMSYADVLVARGRDTGGATDLDTALGVLATVDVDELPDLLHSPYWQLAMITHLSRFYATAPGDPRHLVAAIAASTEVIDDPGSEAGVRDEARTVRASARLDHARVTQDLMADVESIIADLEAARGRISPQLAPGVEAQLALVLTERARRTSDPRDIDRAIAFVGDALDRLPPGTPFRAQLAFHLASALSQGVETGRGGPWMLDRAIDLFQSVVDEATANPTLAAAARAQLGSVMAYRVYHRGGDDAGIDAAIAHLTSAFAMAPVDDVNRVAIVVGLANALMYRYESRGDIADLQWSHDLVNDLRNDRIGDAGRPLIELILGQVLLAWHESFGADTLDEAISVLTTCASNAAAGGTRPEALRVLAAVHSRRATLTQDQGNWRSAVDCATRALAETRPDAVNAEMFRASAGGVLLLAGRALDEVALVRTGVEHLRGIADGRLPHAMRARYLAMYGMALLYLYQQDGTRADLTRAIGVLTEASALIAARPGARESPEVMMALATAHEAAGEGRDATKVGLGALRSHAWQVLLQSGTHQAMAAVRQGAADAVHVARVALRAGDPDGAYAALETGRALVLHAATVTATVPDLLRVASHPGLADEWSVAVSTADPNAAMWRTAVPVVPSDLRYRALTALSGHPLLFDPPSLGSLRDALRTVGADALIYLFAGEEGVDGLALVVPADGQIFPVDLPALTADWSAPTMTAQANTARDLGPAMDAATRRELDDVCDAAWTAVVGPLLDRWRDDHAGEPHLVMTPAGTLAAVPWHAARSADEPRRWAIDEAVLSYIASGRLLVDVAARTGPPPGPIGLVIGDPDTGDSAPGLPNAGIEASTIFQRHYRAGRYLGRPADLASGPGRPADVLAWIAGTDMPHASVLHLACHGVVRADGPATSFLQLAGETLSAEQILHAAAHRRVDTSPGLVSLAACTTHLAGRAYDEAVTLSTAFLVAGAKTAIGSLWPVPDRETALLMVAFHDNLATGMRPNHALRVAQRWMRDSTGATLVQWAGFVHMGV
jgi:hypothetical protein